MSGIARLALCAVLLATAPVLTGSALAGEATLWMSPIKVVLNAQGQFEDIEGNFAVSLPSSTFESFDFGLYLDDVLVSEAFAVRYCVIDDVLSVSFDREALQANPDVQAMAGMIVEARVEGSLVVVDGEATREVSLLGYDELEILSPGRAGSSR